MVDYKVDYYHEFLKDFLMSRGITENSDHKNERKFYVMLKEKLLYLACVKDNPNNVRVAVDVIKLLENKDLLTPNEILNENWRKSYEEFIHPKLWNDSIIKVLIKECISFTSTKVGCGEFAIPLIVEDYRWSNKKGDGLVDGKYKSELGNGETGKALKSNEDSELRVVDEVVGDLLGGHALGFKTGHKRKLYEEFIENKYNSVESREKMFKELLKLVWKTPEGLKVSDELCQKLALNYKDPVKCNTLIGLEVIKRYKNIDGWNNLLLINEKRETMVNIHDVSDIDVDGLGLVLTPKFKRGKDTNAIGDGYAVVKIGGVK